MNRIRRWLPRAIFESFLIIVSILLALAVNEWREHRQRVERAAEMRAVFRNEIESNRELLQSDIYLPHHERLQKEYQQLFAANSTEMGSLFETGVHPAPLRDAAWRAFSTSQTVADFKPAELVMLSDIYHSQDLLTTMNANFVAQIAAPRADRENPDYKRDQTRSITFYLNDLVPLEHGLLEQYDEALADLK